MRNDTVTSHDLRVLIDLRDKAIGDIDPYLPKTLASMMDNGRVQFPDGSVLRRVANITSQQDFNEIRREEIVVEYKLPNGKEYHFAFDVYYNSWDDGNPDEWEFDHDPRPMRKVPVTTFKWEVV